MVQGMDEFANGRGAYVLAAHPDWRESRVNRLLLRNVDVVGCSFGVLSSDRDGFTSTVDRLADLVAAGGIDPVVGSVYPLDEAKQALREIDERLATGKVVLTLGD